MSAAEKVKAYREWCIKYLPYSHEDGRRMDLASAAISALEAENEALRGNLRSVSEMGHNDDCLFCARKDFNAQKWAMREEE